MAGTVEGLTGRPLAVSGELSFEVVVAPNEQGWRLRHVLDGVLEDEGASFVGTFGGVTVRLERQ